MGLSWPEFPQDLSGQLAFLAAIFSLMTGFILMVVPRAYGLLIQLSEREGRKGAIGEVRSAGGFLFGLALATLLFEQSDLYLALGTGFAGAAFGRILALMSDRAVSAFNLGTLLVQMMVAGVLMATLFEVWTPDAIVGLPEGAGGLAAFISAAIIASFGALVMFAPRLAFFTSGLSMQGDREAAMGTARAYGGFALAVGGAVMLISSQMLYLALGVACLAAASGRLISLVVERGNLIFQAFALLGTLALASAPIAYVFSLV